MKNKKAEQIEAKRKHRELLKSQRKLEPSLERKEPSIPEKPKILIVCEGKNTEPSYFNQFRLSTVTVESVGEGYNTISLVKRAIQLSKNKDYKQVWCVFDKDDFSKKDFNGAIQMAEKKGFGVAYSNQAFEYWMILHFDDHQGGEMHRHDYDKKINALLKSFGLTYDGTVSKIITEEIFEVMEAIDKKVGKTRKEIAIERAKRNFNQFDHQSPAIEESSTTVFRLVEELMKYV